MACCCCASNSLFSSFVKVEAIAEMDIFPTVSISQGKSQAEGLVTNQGKISPVLATAAVSDFNNFNGSGEGDKVLHEARETKRESRQLDLGNISSFIMVFVDAPTYPHIHH